MTGRNLPTWAKASIAFWAAVICLCITIGMDRGPKYGIQGLFFCGSAYAIVWLVSYIPL